MRQYVCTTWRSQIFVLTLPSPCTHSSQDVGPAPTPSSRYLCLARCRHNCSDLLRIWQWVSVKARRPAGLVLSLQSWPSKEENKAGSDIPYILVPQVPRGKATHPASTRTGTEPASHFKQHEVLEPWRSCTSDFWWDVFWWWFTGVGNREGRRDWVTLDMQGRKGWPQAASTTPINQPQLLKSSGLEKTGGGRGSLRGGQIRWPCCLTASVNGTLASLSAKCQATETWGLF